MNPMMNTIGTDYGFTALWALHIFSVIAFFIGVVFLVVLAVKTFTPAQLKQWAIWLLVGGTVVCLFTIGMIGRPWIGYWHANGGMGSMQMQQMGQMMNMMMEHNESAPNGDHDEMREMLEGMMKGAGNRPGMMQ